LFRNRQQTIPPPLCTNVKRQKNEIMNSPRTKMHICKPQHNLQKHHRRSIRLKGYDYSQAGLYFITICCQDRICRFGHIENSEMIINELGMVAYNEWAKLPERFPNFE